MFEVLSNKGEDYKKWLSLWEESNRKDVHMHPDYLQLYCEEGMESKCAYLSSESGTVFFPFIIRQIKLGEGISSDGNFKDITTPYGFGGYDIVGICDENLIKEFYSYLSHWEKSNNVVTEFTRFFLDMENLYNFPGDVVLKNECIVVDLTLNEEQQWSNFKHKVRKNVKKALKSGVTIAEDATGQTLDSFLDIYYSTMERREANAGYYFSKEFFESIIQNLKGCFMFFNAIHENKIISTELVLLSKENIYSFLGGTNEEFFELRPNDLLKFEIIKWGIKEGKKHFILGGGYHPHDGIFSYKLSFAPEGIKPFHVGERILDFKTFSDLTNKVLERKKNLNFGITYFPLYRI